MTRFAYPTSAMLGDYVRAAAGLVPTAAILAMTPFGVTAAVVLGGFASLFAVFGIRTALRHGTRFEMSEEAVERVGAAALLDRVERARPYEACLLFYTARPPRAGWMQLELRSAGKG